MKYLLPASFLFIISCNIGDVLPPPKAQEYYYNQLSQENKILWDSLESLIVGEKVEIDLPYQENLVADAHLPSFHAYKLKLKYGQILKVDLNSIDAFVSIFKVEGDSNKTAKKVYEQIYLKEEHIYEVEETASYLLQIKNKLGISKKLNLQLSTQPAYSFPVAGGKERDIGSFWGDPRDGGRRKHKGIDIFAKRGRPLIACVSGRIRSVRERGLGGKQIWLADRLRNQSIYYAHLNEQLVKEGQYVEKGDTIGTVGNTGNARTTPPHLHFGIYKSGIGALDPLYFVQPEKTKYILPNAPYQEGFRRAEVGRRQANFRIGPSNKKKIIRTLSEEEVLYVIGISGNWYHVRSDLGDAGYIYKSSLRFNLESS